MWVYTDCLCLSCLVYDMFNTFAGFAMSLHHATDLVQQLSKSSTHGFRSFYFDNILTAFVTQGSWSQVSFAQQLALVALVGFKALAKRQLSHPLVYT